MLEFVLSFSCLIILSPKMSKQSNQQSQQQQQTTTTINDQDDWVVADAADNATTDNIASTQSTPLNLDWMTSIFPSKEKQKIETWLAELHRNEFDNLELLQSLNEKGWEKLNLPLAVKSVIQRAFEKVNALEVQDLALPVTPVAPKEISQVDCVVIDVSSSMKARSHIDSDKSREDVSKMLFHTLIDKLICLELSHAVALIAFGENIIRFEATKDYERFHDELGRLDANEGSTKLYDAILNAAVFIDDYVQINGLESDSRNEPLRKRIFVLTDGEDNSSKKQAWEVAQFLQSKNIQLDAIPLATENAKLQRMCLATGGLFFNVTSIEQSMDLFERESMLHISYRDAPTTTPVPQIVSNATFESIEVTQSTVVEMKSAAPKQLYAPALSSFAAQQKAEEASRTVSAPGSLRRIMKEYLALTKSPESGFLIFMNADDTYSWKAILTDLPDVYAGGSWLLTIDFPSNFPLSPPKIKFYTPIFHCNVSVDGRICLEELFNWSPGTTIGNCLNAIRKLMLKPDANSPLDSYKASLYTDYIVNGNQAYQRLAKEYTQTHASEPVESLIAKYNLDRTDL